MNDAAAPRMSIVIQQEDVCVTQPVITVENKVDHKHTFPLNEKLFFFIEELL